MNTLKLTRLAAGCALALGLAACGADGTGTGSDTGAKNATSAQICADLLKDNRDGAIDTTQGTLCTLLEGTPAGPLNDVLDNLIGTDGTLGDLTSPLNDLIGPDGSLAPLNELLVALLGANGNGALTPLINGLNSVLVLLNAGEDPAAITDALSQFGNGTATGSPLDALLALGGTDNPLTALIGQLPGLDRLPGAGGSTPATGDNAGVITSAQTLVGTLTNNTQLTAVNDLVTTLLDPSVGALSPLTSQLEALTNSKDGALGPLTDVIDGLIAQNDAALAPVITALNGVLVGLLTNQDPAAIAEALQGLATGLGGNNPFAGLALPGGSTPSTGGNTGLIDSVQSIVANLTDDTALSQLQGLVDQLAGADNGALNAITGPLNDLTADQLSALTGLVDQLAVVPGSPVGAVVDGLNGVIGGLLGALSIPGIG